MACPMGVVEHRGRIVLRKAPIEDRSLMSRVRHGDGETRAQQLGIGRRHEAGCTAQTHEVITAIRSEEHTSELQSLMRISYAVFCLKKKKKKKNIIQHAP